MAYFPFFVDLSGQRGLIVGGGTVALRKAEKLLPYGPELTVVAPEPVPALTALPVTLERRRFRETDLEGAGFVIAATDDREVNRRVGEDARARHIPVSVADCPEECTFYFPAVCEGKNVAAGVVSRGSDHRATARAAEKIRRVLEELE